MIIDLLLYLGGWDDTKLNNNFLSYEIDAIRKVHLNGTNYKDERYWNHDKKGHYTVIMGY